MREERGGGRTQVEGVDRWTEREKAEERFEKNAK